MIIRATNLNDFIDIDLQDAQYIDKNIMQNFDFSELLKNKCWTVELDNEILLIGGLCKIHQYRYLAWSFISKHAGKKLLLITRKIKQYLSLFVGRIECQVSPEFYNGNKWAVLLGFNFEAKLKCYMENMSDANMYSKINEVKKMADPVTLGVGALVGGTVLQSVGSIMGGQSNAANLQAQENAANYNAELYNQQAKQASATAVASANQQQVTADQAQGAQRAAVAESGAGWGGTNALLINQSGFNAEQDRENILYQGILQNQSDRAQASQSQYNAEVSGSQINSALDAGYMGAGASLLSGLGNAALLGYKRKSGYLPSNPFTNG